MCYTMESLIEAKRQINSTVDKTRKVVNTFMAKENSNRYKSQTTLAERRIEAFEIALVLIEAEISNLSAKES